MKSKITFTYENEWTSDSFDSCTVPRKLTIEIPADITLHQLIEHFEMFTKGIGYFPPENSHLDYIDNDTQKEID